MRLACKVRVAACYKLHDSLPGPRKRHATRRPCHATCSIIHDAYYMVHMYIRFHNPPSAAARSSVELRILLWVSVTTPIRSTGLLPLRMPPRPPLHATCYVPLATCHLLDALCCMPHAASCTVHAACYLIHTTCYVVYLYCLPHACVMGVCDAAYYQVHDSLPDPCMFRATCRP